MPPTEKIATERDHRDVSSSGEMASPVRSDKVLLKKLRMICKRKQVGTELQPSGRHFALRRGVVTSEVFLLFSWRQKARIYPKNSAGSNKSYKGKMKVQKEELGEVQ